MTEEIIKRYIADDGKVFDDEYECREYEGSLYEDDVSFYCKSCTTEKITFTKLQTTENNVGNCDVIIVKSIKGAEWVKHAGYEYGTCTPFDRNRPQKTGIFIYNGNNDEWDDWEEYFKSMTEQNEMLMKLFRK